MCDKHDSKASTPRHGSRLADGKAHEIDHRRWSRRGFLTSLGAFSAGSLFLGRTPVEAFASSPLLSASQIKNENRVLVLIQLKGGNDGLNTIVPIEDDIYYNLRPGISIPKAEASAFKVSDDFGTHPSLAPFESYFLDGQMAIVQNVGYPDTTLSHFRSQDIWITGTSADVVVGSGWAGRYLEGAFPEFAANPSDTPLAVRIGAPAPQMFRGQTTDMGMSLGGKDFLERLISNGELYSTSDVPDTTYGQEISFLRTVTNNSFRYSDSIIEAATQGNNEVEYGGGEGKLSDNLATVARLIKGNLGAKIYHVSLAGFDTHAGQLNSHESLLDTLANSVDAFLQDIGQIDNDTEVLVMTYSEFGRRVAQNGSAGTDHGQGAPLFLFGSGVLGGLYGAPPNLTSLDTGNVIFDIDYRNVYGSILNQWFGFKKTEVTTALLGFQHTPVNFIANPSPVASEYEPPLPGTFSLEQNYPNPFANQTTIRFDVEKAGPVELEVFNISGQKVATLVSGSTAAGTHSVTFDGSRLPSGTYLYRLKTTSGIVSKRMVLVR